MRAVAIQLLCSAVLLGLWVYHHNPFDLWISGVSFGVALTTTFIIDWWRPLP